MDVDTGYFATPQQDAGALPAIAQASGWMGAALEAGLTVGIGADIQQGAPDDTHRADEKFGVYRETLFDFRDYGLD
ncbi:hypothetical protein [Sphingomonas sp.]|uniref:hypothetical protein n=1 Tax=Sphingomonas sp. TaxID=28214 RepID=UPI0025F82E7A|nr:hypothetical protein [Sphingomonas sp.]MBV9527593.1 hypothetical protein [Sphingomonas sp.]